MININKKLIIMALMLCGCKANHVFENNRDKLNVVEWREVTLDKEHVTINEKFNLYGVKCPTKFSTNKATNKCFWQENKIFIMIEREMACAGEKYDDKDFSYCFNELRSYLRGESPSPSPYADFAARAYGEVADEIGLSDDKIYFSIAKEGLPDCLIMTSDATIITISGSLPIAKKKEICKSISLRKL